MAGRHRRPLGRQFAVLGRPAARHRKIQAATRKILGRSFQAGHKTAGPGERE